MQRAEGHLLGLDVNLDRRGIAVLSTAAVLVTGAWKVGGTVIELYERWRALETRIEHLERWKCALTGDSVIVDGKRVPTFNWQKECK